MASIDKGVRRHANVLEKFRSEIGWENGEAIAELALTRKTYEATREEYERKKPSIT